uniref:Acetyl-CoA carboxylase n=1 Tax=Stygiella incarcerata TaxID=1712417 RepID=A0A192ZIT2_9EUKA|nr:acetyl-CoA carboxylase [Stygiella incarcerata]|eukprot:TRINITY_DN823_c0_g1_i1.p1 TRINITY_DN823_c0_g1~~TRINITY_DN823_c0_g1_i1.p1  ORF type:complete len:2172 (+),score=616.18 TRINITY_DN823_c0_g1_i1:123-6638(+)
MSWKSVADYVRDRGGVRPIQRLLIANNGIAAVKAIRSIRKWAYQTFGDEKAVLFVVMATPEDVGANAEYIRMADTFVEVPGGPNVNNYANVELVVDIAERMNVDAVWAGWGHASENPSLPASLGRTHKKIVFLGPGESAMHALGDKISSTIVAQSAGVPCLPWSGSGIYLDEGETLPSPDKCQRACITTVAEALESARKIGYPLMIKASEGGGGKGIRKVTCEEEVESSFRQVQGEVAGSPVFLMRMAEASRHMEIQLLADQYGNAISLKGRDCSVQRRHQKIIEEGPIIAATQSELRVMKDAAVRLAKMVGYSSVGTVEYLYADGKAHFLELNPRLQVEHPVSEWITNVNLPAAQLQVGMGIPLHNIPDIRRLYGEDPFGTSVIDFDTQDQIPPKGHVIAVRITAENPDEGFQPSSGMIQDLTFRNTTNVWGYFSVRSASGVHQFADSQIGHVFAFGDTREESRKAVVMALKELSIRGDIRTTIEYLVYLLERREFIENTIDTLWLDSLIRKKSLPAVQLEPKIAVICGAIHRAHTTWTNNRASFIRSVSRGQTPSSEMLAVEFPVRLIYEDVVYTLTVTKSSNRSYMLCMNGSFVCVKCTKLRDESLFLQIGSRSLVTYSKEEKTGLRLTIGTETYFFPEEEDPSKIRATAPGKIVRFLVRDATMIEEGTPFAEIEVMKMYMPLVSPVAGIIHFAVAEGTSVEVGDMLATMEFQDPSFAIKKAVPCLEGFNIDSIGPADVMKSMKPHQRLRHVVESLESVLSGFSFPKEIADVMMSDYFNDIVRIVNDPLVPYYEFVELMSVLRPSLPKAFSDAISSLLEKFRDQGISGMPFPFQELKSVFTTALKDCATQSIDTVILPLRELMTKYELSNEGHKQRILRRLLQIYVDTESMVPLSGAPREKIVAQLREENKDDLELVFRKCLSWENVASRSRLVTMILAEIEASSSVKYYKPVLESMSKLQSSGALSVSLKAKQLLMAQALPTFDERVSSLLDAFNTLLDVDDDDENKTESLDSVVRDPMITFNVLMAFFRHSNPRIQDLAAEAFVRKSHVGLNVRGFTSTRLGSILVSKWKFMNPTSAFGGQVDFQMPLMRWESALGLTLGSSGSTSSLPHITDPEIQYSVLLVVESSQHIVDHVEDLFQEIENDSSGDRSITMVRVVVLNEEPVTAITNCVATLKERLFEHDIRRITFAIPGKRVSDNLRHYTFRRRLDYAEDPIYRNVDPLFAYLLETRRLKNYDVKLIPSSNPQVHLYYAKGTSGDRGRGANSSYSRFFVRCLIQESDAFSAFNQQAYQLSEAERLFAETLNELEVAKGNPEMNKARYNHILVTVVPVVLFDLKLIRRVVHKIASTHMKRMVALGVAYVEAKLFVKTAPTAEPKTCRFTVSNETGHDMRIDTYVEKVGVDGGTAVFSSLFGEGPWNGISVNTPYEPLTMIQIKRMVAARTKSMYVYDFPILLAKALSDVWRKQRPSETRPDSLVICKEFVLEEGDMEDENRSIVLIDREPGRNTIGMVAWEMTIFSPEAPQGEGRKIIVIANDITFQSGSFSTEEDLLFQRVSQHAREKGLPRIYISSNSGARLGFAEEVKPVFRVMWKNPTDPGSGFDYLFVREEDYFELEKTKSIRAKRVVSDDGRVHYRITDIIGKKHGLGVENLRGSGMIAGETSRAYEETFTLSYVTGRTVGIGAYVVRLGQRTIQKADSPILLTGAQALNRVLGKNVYSSNIQIGGPQIMYDNGVSHIVVDDDFQGVLEIVRWLQFVPAHRGESPPVYQPVFDLPDRSVEYIPSATSVQDPRFMITGNYDAQGIWRGGIFDRDSFQETLAGWARNVICGRARLGGVPVGVISVETRRIDSVVPADPADPDSFEKTMVQAGGVWYPDSAYKTAQAIRDFNKGESLPLFIFANWRGFSGGMRDMHDEILKFGSYIVDSLREYQQPIFVYIPPEGELRGGAWVVLDPTINVDMMEMYADERARGGVLEPQGMIEIKFRDPDLRATMRRLDMVASELFKQSVDLTISPVEREKASKLLQEREAILLPIYRNVAATFADLHDTPGRMLAKKTIRRVLNWRKSRKFFFDRLLRRLFEERILKEMDDEKMTRAEKLDLLYQWAPMDILDDSNDEIIWKWFNRHQEDVIAPKMDELRGKKKRELALEIMRTMSAEQQKEIIKELGL